MSEHYDVYYATLQQVLSTLFEIPEARIEKFAKDNERIVELGVDSLDVVEFGLEFDEATGGNLTKENLDSITLASTYQDLRALAIANMTGCPNLTVVSSDPVEGAKVGTVVGINCGTGIVTSDNTVSVLAEPSHLPCLYFLGQRLQHVKNKDNYIIIELPYEHKRLEDSNEPYYRYRGDDGIEWSRKVSEMEDGRFVAV